MITPKIKPAPIFSPLGSPVPSPPANRFLECCAQYYKRRWYNLALFAVACFCLTHIIRPRPFPHVPVSVSVAVPPRLRQWVTPRVEQACPFQASSNPLPVFERSEAIRYDNHPASVYRPTNQFSACAPVPASAEQPVIILITVTQNPSKHFETSASNLRNQSLQNYHWLVVDDATDDQESLDRLEAAAQADPRLQFLRLSNAVGQAAARNHALATLATEAAFQSPYVAFVDEGDLYELTALEKMVWMLETNPQWDFSSSHQVSYGAQNGVELRGLHSGINKALETDIAGHGTVIRRQALGNCTFEASFEGALDRHYLLCLASSGSWGGTLPELGTWSRTAQSGNATLQRRIDSKYGKLREKADELAARRSPASNTLEAFTWQHPFTNAIADTSSQGSILVIVPWLYMGGADIGALRQIETLTKQGFRVTVVCTLYKAPEGLELRPDMMQWTHDIHVLPSFLRAAEFPRYIVYLAKTRQAKTVFMSNSMLAYEMLPALREQLPDAVFVDYQHNEAYNNWKQGGYPTYSILHQRYLDRTISCSHHVKQWMVERGHDAARIGVVKLGVDLRESVPANVSTRAQLRRSLFKADSKMSIILSVARLDPQKRSTLLPDIIQRLVQDHGYSCRGSTKRLLMVMVGAGDLREALEAKIAALGLENCFALTGIQAETAQYYQSADLFLLPSMSEGISVAVSEAMAAGLPVVAADAGALGEQVGLPSDADQAGLVVAQTLDDAVDAPLYASAVAKLLQDRPTRLRLAQNGLQRVQHSDWHQTLLGLLPELQLARAAHTYPRSPSQLSQLPHPAAQLSVQTQLLENRGLVDLSQIQNSLQAATRSPYGKQLQEACPDNAVSLRWIDALEEKPFCVENAQKEVLALQQSALEQCGSWCVWDLRAEAATGWIFNGGCFRVMEGDECQQYSSSRPTTSLTRR